MRPTRSRKVVSPDILVPALAPTIIDSISSAIDCNWNFSAFKPWCLAFMAADGSGITDDDLIQLIRFRSYYIGDFIEAVWGDSTFDEGEQESILSTKSFPADTGEFHNYRAFVGEVFGSDFYVQGWSDCNFDWEGFETPFRAYRSDPFGESATAIGLRRYAYRE